jgi:hypothetical protein
MSAQPPASSPPSAAPGRWHWKDSAIVLLTLAVIVLSVLLARGGLAFGAAPGGAAGHGREAVAVFDVEVDRDGRRYFDVLFDRPIGEGRVDQILEPAPATLSPSLGGYFRFRDTHALRFEATARLPVATRIRVALIPDRLLPEGYRLRGDSELAITTDPFLVEKVEATEEPALEGEAQVFFRGTVRFNYPVEPRELVSRIRIEDPRAPQGRVAVELETSYRSTVQTFRTQALQKLPEERTVALVIDGGLTSAEGNVPLDTGGGGRGFRQELPLGSAERLVVRRVIPEVNETEPRIAIELSSPVSAAVAARYLTVEAVEGPVKLEPRLSGERNVLYVSAGFAPGKTYRLRLGEGFPARDKAVLQEAYSTELTLPDLPPSVDFESPGLFLSRSGARSVALRSVNTQRLELTIDRVYRNNLFFLARYRGFTYESRGWVGSWFDTSLGDRLVEETLEAGGRRNERRRTVLELGRRVAAEPPGLYQVTVRRGGTDEGVQRWLLITDLGVVAKRGEDGIEVWVSSLHDLAAVAGARVRLVSDQNQEIAAATTDGQGRARFEDRRQPGAAPLFEQRRPLFLTVEKGEDWSFLLFDETRVDWTGSDVGGVPRSPTGYRAFLYGERDLYRPGETAETAALVRDGLLQAPPAMPVVLRHRDPRGRALATYSAATDPRGVVELTFPVPRESLTGPHSLELLVAEEVVGAYRFQVEDFVPDRIEVRVDPGADPVGPGQDLGFEVASAYLFGPPAAGLPVEARVRVVDATFTAAGFPGYVFRNGELSFTDREILSQEGTLDEAGRGRFAARIPAGARVPSTLEAVITARVQEVGGRGVAAVARRRVDPYPYFLGLKAPEGYGDPGKPVELSWVAAAPDGKPAKAGALRADLYLERYHTVLRQVPGGGFRYESTREAEVVDSRTVEGGASGGRFSFVPAKTGSYQVVLSDPDTAASTAVRFYVSGWGFAPWAVENAARVELDLERDEYAPGDTARVQVRAPFPGRLLLTVERERVFWSRVVELTGNTGVVEVPVTEAYRPNAYVVATLLRGARDLPPDSPGRASGAIALPVDRASNRLDLAVGAPAEMRPERRLEVTVTAVPGAAVTVAAVDEGVLQLIAQRTPDPFSFFYRKLALGVSTHDLFALLLPEVSAAGPAGGGDDLVGQALSLRTEGIRRAEPVALWSGVRTAGADGRLTVGFDVPAMTGALRVMAVAAVDRRFGSAEARVRVREPLVLLPTVPLVLAPGDRAELPVSVRNDTGREGPVTVRLETSGPVRLEGTPPPPRTLADGAQETVFFPVTAAEATGLARFTFRAEGLGEQARVVEETPLRAELPVLHEGESGAVTERRQTLPVRDPERFRPDTLKRRLTLGPVPLVRLGADLEDLLEYPYGCLEQTVSRAFPLLYLEDLARQLAPRLLEERHPAEWVDEAVAKLATFQLDNGGFSLWPGGEEADPWVSLYATHFLVEAARAGHQVPDFVHEQGLAWAASEVRAKGTYGADELERTAYGAYVLARAGRADRATMDFLTERHRGALKPSSRALLAAAYTASGDPGAVAPLASGLSDAEEVERQTGRNLGSTRRNRALLLLALLDAAPEDPRIPELADRVAREAAGAGGLTTQEAAFTFLALGQLYRRQGERPPYVGSVFLGGRKVGDFDSRPVTFDGLAGTEPLVVEMRGDYAPGSAFFSLTLRGVPTREAFRPRAAGLEVRRRLLNRNGQPADPARVQQGDLLVFEMQVRSVAGPLDNVVVEGLLPAGFQVENPRLATTETLPWLDEAPPAPAYADLRDDRVLVFLSLPANQWRTSYALVRAVTPGTYHFPPLHAEALYDPRISATGEVGQVVVGR